MKTTLRRTRGSSRTPSSAGTSAHRSDPAADALLARFETYLLGDRGLNRATAAAYISDVRQFLAGEPGLAEEPSGLSRAAGERFLRRLGQAGLGRASIARKFSALRVFARFLTDSSQLDGDPLADVELPRRSRRLPGVLSQDEVRRILDACADPKDRFWTLRTRAMLETVYACGLRASELLGLKTSDVALADGFVRVLGKRGKERVVPLGRPAAEALRQYLELGRPHFAGRRVSPYLFLNARGGRLSRMGFFKLLRRVVAQSGVARRVTAHTFRHSFATHLLEGGADLRAVQEMLGHSQITTTQIYTNVDREYVREVHRTFHPRG
jgi:integrase/recombinase XerD